MYTVLRFHWLCNGVHRKRILKSPVCIKKIKTLFQRNHGFVWWHHSRMKHLHLCQHCHCPNCHLWGVRRVVLCALVRIPTILYGMLIHTDRTIRGECGYNTAGVWQSKAMASMHAVKSRHLVLRTWSILSTIQQMWIPQDNMCICFYACLSHRLDMLYSTIIKGCLPASTQLLNLPC
jgi:hypothetical protein